MTINIDLSQVKNNIICSNNLHIYKNIVTSWDDLKHSENQSKSINNWSHPYIKKYGLCLGKNKQYLC